MCIWARWVSFPVQAIEGTGCPKDNRMGVPEPSCSGPESGGLQIRIPVQKIASGFVQGRRFHDLADEPGHHTSESPTTIANSSSTARCRFSGAHSRCFAAPASSVNPFRVLYARISNLVGDRENSGAIRLLRAVGGSVRWVDRQPSMGGTDPVPCAAVLARFAK